MRGSALQRGDIVRVLNNPVGFRTQYDTHKAAEEGDVFVVNRVEGFSVYSHDEYVINGNRLVRTATRQGDARNTKRTPLLVPPGVHVSIWHAIHNYRVTRQRIYLELGLYDLAESMCSPGHFFCGLFVGGLAVVSLIGIFEHYW